MIARTAKSLLISRRHNARAISIVPRPTNGVACFAGLLVVLVAIADASAISEWTRHRSANGSHPNGNEQALVWLMNRARANPGAEGAWLARSNHPEIAHPREAWSVNTTMLINEFRDIAPRAPAAFDYRIYLAARNHALDLIRRDAQDHQGQFERFRNLVPGWAEFNGGVYSYANSPLHAHAAFNIDWGPGPGNMQTGRGHRVGVMSDRKNYTNVGVAVIRENDDATAIGRFVVVTNHARLLSGDAGNANRFLVGTVWTDTNGNGRYDPPEGIGGVTVQPDSGPYYATTAAGGGYAFPVGANRSLRVRFSGGGVIPTSAMVRVNKKSVLLDYETNSGRAGNGSAATAITSLTYDHLDTGKYGWRYGGADQKTAVRFSFDGNDRDVLLRVSGWDINSADEVTVIVNGKTIGRLGTTAARKTGAADRFTIPASDLRSFNQVVFKQKYAGRTWGIRNLLVKQINCCTP